MPKFLFWNLAKKNVTGFVTMAAERHQVDVLILAECCFPPAQLLQDLNHAAPNYQYSPGNCDHLQFFTRFDSNLLVPLSESSRVSIRRLQLPPHQPILVAGAHLPSKIHFTPESLQFECTHLAQQIDAVESQEGHQRTLLLGDLNMHPFEPGIVGAAGLNAVMSRHIAAGRPRTVQGRKYKFFYNPMWNHLGDNAGQACGTFFWPGSEHVCYFWNMFDQLLLRPALLPGFNQDKVQVLNYAGDVSLLTDDGWPNKDMVSDHLPVLLELDF